MGAGATVGADGALAWHHGLFFSRAPARVCSGIGVACWAARRDRRSPAQLGVLAAVLIYNVVVAAVLVFAAVAVRMVGIVLWPAIVFHMAMAVWCGVCSRATGER